MKHAVQHLHFVGIGGAGMSAIAEILHWQGYRVSGSDRADGPVMRRLAGLGLKVFVGHDAAHIEGAQVVVTSSAVAQNNPEVQAARGRGIPVVARAVLLAELMRTQRGIAIAGTHGKTTTTSLVASVLLEAGLDPSFVIGGQLQSTQSNARLGQGAFIVAEADESDASFLQLDPVLAVVTNIDADHMDTYGHDLARLHDAFVEFLHRLPFYGHAVLCSDDAGVRAIQSRLQRPVLAYGFGDDADVQALQVRARHGGGMAFTLRRRGAADLPLELALSGEHNVRNALAAAAVAQLLHVDDAALARALAGFAGVDRRFTQCGECAVPGGGAFTLVDDYGHHPVEMAAVLAAARGAFPGRRLVLVFQPHRYTRTRDCRHDFAAVMGGFDAVLLTEVYAAGEARIAGADGASLAQLLRAAGRVDPVFVPEVSALPLAMLGAARDGDVFITMGAGSIAEVPAQLRSMTGGRT